MRSIINNKWEWCH